VSVRASQPRQLLLLASAVVAALFPSAACSPSHPPGHGGDEQAATLAPYLPGYPTFPLDRYRPTAEQRHALLSAEFHLADTCAAQHGITIQLVPPAARSDFLLMYAMDLRPVNMADARALGYHLPPSGTSAADDAIAKLPPAQAETMIGWNSTSTLPKPRSTFLLTGGCVGQAVRQLTASDQSSGADEQYVDQLIGNSLNQAQADPGLAGPVGQWSSCLEKSGYGSFATPREAIAAAQPAGTITIKEVKQAEQDVRCKESSQLTKTWISLLTRYQHQAVDAHRKELDEIGARLQQRLMRAASIGN
jgi:hypothetical protein